MFIWMILLYAVVASGIAAYLYYDKTQREAKDEAADSKVHPFLAIPDFFGQYERAERKKPTKIEGMPSGKLRTPPELQVRLAQSKTVGDLEVSPLRVELRNITFFQKRPGFGNVFGDRKIMLLYLRLKNLSDDIYFNPTDPFFNRSTRSQTEGFPLYTGIVVGKEDFMGGPFLWPDPSSLYLDGQQQDAKPLAPKEERDYVIGSIIDYPIVLRAAKENDTPLTWQVQLRRGLERVKNEAGEEKDISVSSVFGVVFDKTDIIQPN